MTPHAIFLTDDLHATLARFLPHPTDRIFTSLGMPHASLLPHFIVARLPLRYNTLHLARRNLLLHYALIRSTLCVNVFDDFFFSVYQFTCLRSLFTTTNATRSSSGV